MTPVKICGITNLDDAIEAQRLGAWALGLIHADSPRRCEPTAAAQIGAAMKRQCEIVGVFVNPTLDEVNKAVENAGLTMVQLSGDEGPVFCTEVARRTGARVVKGFHVSSAADIHASAAFRTEYHLFDTRKIGLYGGTGKSFDWNLLAKRRPGIPAVLAGGLRPENVVDAIAIARPDAVDVASGIEAEPGRKDHAAMAAFFEAAQPLPVEPPEPAPEPEPRRVTS